MKIILRRATKADAKHTASLLTELGYPSTEADARDRLVRSLRSATSYCLVAESAAEVVGLISAELIFYFPTGSTICRITSLVVSSQHRGHGLGQRLLTAAIDFAREHHCSGLELTSAEARVDAHRFYRRLGFPDIASILPNSLMHHSSVSTEGRVRQGLDVAGDRIGPLSAICPLADMILAAAHFSSAMVACTRFHGHGV